MTDRYDDQLFLFSEESHEAPVASRVSSITPEMQQRYKERAGYDDDKDDNSAYGELGGGVDGVVLSFAEKQKRKQHQRRSRGIGRVGVGWQGTAAEAEPVENPDQRLALESEYAERNRTVANHARVMKAHSLIRKASDAATQSERVSYMGKLRKHIELHPDTYFGPIKH